MATKKKSSKKRPAKKLTKKELAELKKRKDAAVKGWVTRRRKTIVDKVKDLIDKVDPKDAASIIRFEAKKKKKKPSKWAQDFAKKLVDAKDYESFGKLLEVQILTADFVPMHDPEFLTRDGTIALYPSRARHLGKFTSWAMREMKKAFKQGEDRFNSTVERIAESLNLPVREVYTLWYSP